MLSLWLNFKRLRKTRKRRLSNMERVSELLEYLNVLSQVQGAGHYVNEEIKEVVKEIRLELGLEKRKQDTLKQSRFLVFQAKLGDKASLVQVSLFEAVFGNHKGAFHVYYDPAEANDVVEAVNVLNKMQNDVVLKAHKTQYAVEVNRK
ncbi:hypothetical protein [Bacillus phage PK2]|nr:hypothetical protein [Bacillus phage PK2]